MHRHSLFCPPSVQKCYLS